MLTVRQLVDALKMERALGIQPGERPGCRTPSPPTSPQRSPMISIRPLQDRVIVKRVKADEVSKGGIIIPDNAKEKPIEGEVLAVGNGFVLENGNVRPLDVKTGDRVLFTKYGGNEAKLDGEDVLILREGDILAVLDAS